MPPVRCRRGAFRNHLNNFPFVAVFPADCPRYVIYVLVAHLKMTKKMQKFSNGFTTGGYVAALATQQIKLAASVPWARNRTVTRDDGAHT